jgi:hypothetical protein
MVAGPLEEEKKLGCKQGWIMGDDNHTCVKVYTREEHLEAAVNFCADEGSKMVSINSLTEHMNMVKL